MTITETTPSSTPLSQPVALVAHHGSVSPVEAQALQWIHEHPPYICEAYDIHKALNVSMKYANKLLERLERKGHLKRYATGRYELAEKPLAAFMPEAVAVGGIVHRALGGTVVVGPRVHGLQFSVRSGEAGVNAYRRVSSGKK